jgi:hypothetical protein
MEVAMENESVKLGRINRYVEKAIEENFEGDVTIYMEEKDVDELARRAPDDYLRRLSEASRIIKNPDYVSYSKPRRTLFLIREYLNDGEFKKVVLEIVDEGKWKFHLMYALSALQAKELDASFGIKRIKR